VCDAVPAGRLPLERGVLAARQQPRCDDRCIAGSAVQGDARTMTRLRHRVLLSTALAVSVAGMAAADGPSRDLSTYVRFVTTGMRARGFHIESGDVGVNQGGLVAHDAIDGPDSTLAGDVVSVGGRSRCARLFFTDAAQPAAGCGPGTQYQGLTVPD